MNEEEFFDALEYVFKNEEVCRGGGRGMVSWRCGATSITYASGVCTWVKGHTESSHLHPQEMVRRPKQGTEVSALDSRTVCHSVVCLCHGILEYSCHLVMSCCLEQSVILSCHAA